MLRETILFLLALTSLQVYSQTGKVSGTITSENTPVPFVNVYLQGTSIGTTSNENGKFVLDNIEYGSYQLVASLTGFSEGIKSILIDQKKSTLTVDFSLAENAYQIEEVVVSGTRTSKKITDSPVMVNVLNQRTLESVQACNLSDGLKFQPGLRVETNCQTCNYTQLRMNGLGGSYSQILINGRPIFSPLLGLYGLEQIPTNMLDRVEVIRGGGSALYGSSAIGGTVNIITKLPTKNSYDIGYTSQLINSKASDHNWVGNANHIRKSKKIEALFC